MRRSIVLAMVCLYATLVGTVAEGIAQHLFLDVTGDGMATEADRLKGTEPMTVDVWLNSERNRDGTPVRVGPEGAPLSVRGYELVLVAVGGEVSWGEWINRQPRMEISLGYAASPKELHVGHIGLDALPPGKHLLGSVTVRVLSGDPSIGFASRSTVSYGGLTALASTAVGKDGDYYLKYTSDRSRLNNSVPEEPGDWADVDGLRTAAGPSEAPTMSLGDQATRATFRVRLSSNPIKQTGEITITTTQPGYLRVSLFDVRGRLVRTLVERETAPPGDHHVPLDSPNGERFRLSSGVYFYTVDSPERNVQGRIVVLK